MRIQKYLSQQGICSRREAEEFIRRGLIMLNGTVVREMGVMVDPEKDVVELRAEKASPKESIIISKPRGIVSSRNSTEGKTIFDVFPQYTDLHIVGRLDKESEGLLLLTNDGVIARRVTGKEHVVEKEYEVTVQENIAPNKIEPLTKSITLQDGPTLPAKVRFIDQHTFRITLREGRKHQIRRMCDHLRLSVTRLVRLRIGNLTLKGLSPGAARPLTKEEAQTLRSSS